MFTHRSLRPIVLALALLAVPRIGASVGAQTADSLCEYSRCALGISPRTTALDIVRGDSAERVASLSFIWPTDVSGVFLRDSVAWSFATRAVRHRRLAAFFTDAGILSGVVGVVAIGTGHHAPGAAFAATGAMLFVASVPIHFSADADLSRAVWRFNRRYSR